MGNGKKEGRSPVFNQPYGGYVCPRIMQSQLDHSINPRKVGTCEYDRVQWVQKALRDAAYSGSIAMESLKTTPISVFYYQMLVYLDGT